MTQTQTEKNIIVKADDGMRLVNETDKVVATTVVMPLTATFSDRWLELSEDDAAALQEEWQDNEAVE